MYLFMHNKTKENQKYEPIENTIIGSLFIPLNITHF